MINPEGVSQTGMLVRAAYLGRAVAKKNLDQVPHHLAASFLDLEEVVGPKIALKVLHDVSGWDYTREEVLAFGDDKTFVDFALHWTKRPNIT